MTTLYLLVIAYWLACYAYAIEKGKGLCLLAFDSVLVFLAMPMGFDLDCYVPFSPPSPKKFTVFRGSAILSFILLRSIVLNPGLAAVTAIPVL